MKTVSAFVTALMVFSLALTSFGTSADARHGRNTAIGIAAGIATLAIIAGASRARAERYDDDEEYRPRRYRSGGGISCSRLLRKCNNGSNWACEKYETGGCTE